MPAQIFEKYIRQIPDFPKPGIQFKDVTPLLSEGKAFRSVTEVLRQSMQSDGIQKIVGIESRGFILGAAVATQLGVGLSLVRKKGKLPAAKFTESYELEYGTDHLEIHQDSIGPGERIAIVDDVLATGGTAAAAARLCARCSADIGGFYFLIELKNLGGRTKLDPYQVFSLIQY